MKKVIIPMACVVTFAVLTSCGGSGDENKTDTMSVTTTSETSAMTSSSDSAGMSSTSTPAYMDLSTNKQVTVEKDPKTGYFMNKETHKRVDYYFDPATNDTFDYQGRVVNMAIMKGADGMYKVDEARIKVQGDGDLKMKSADGDTKIKIETNGDMKMKNDTMKLKIKEGKMKIKSKE